MKRLLSTWVLLMMTPATAFGQAEAERIDLLSFRKLHEAKAVLVVDVRDAQAFAKGHIPDAINIPLGNEQHDERMQTLRAETRPIVTYCA